MITADEAYWLAQNDDSAHVRHLCATVIAQAEIIDRVAALADKWERGALRWADPLPVPPEVGLIREALGVQS